MVKELYIPVSKIRLVHCCQNVTDYEGLEVPLSLSSNELVMYYNTYSYTPKLIDTASLSYSMIVVYSLGTTEVWAWPMKIHPKTSLTFP